MIWPLAALLAAVSAVVILWPMLRRATNTQDRNDHALAIFKDQLAELDKDQSRGLISQSESEAAQTEIKRRMLSTARTDRAAQTSGGTAGILIAAIAVPLLGAGLYSQLGAPSIASQPYDDRAAERQAENSEATEIAELAQRVRTKLLSEPDGGETRGWYLLSQTYMRMGRYDAAVDALQRIEDRKEADAIIFTAYAEALVSADRGTVTPLAQKQIDRALAQAPQDPRAVYYNALGLQQRGRAEQAHANLLARLKTAEPNAGWIPLYIERANAIGQEFGAAPLNAQDFAQSNGPSAEDVEAASELSDTDRAAFINSMVEQLASRLEENPNNLEGWLRLAQAYTVLNRPDDARKAYQSAAPLVADLPDGDPRKSAVAAGLAN